jgi:hypothetical protein
MLIYIEVLPLSHYNLQKLSAMDTVDIAERHSEFRNILISNGVLNDFFSADPLDKEDLCVRIKEPHPSSPPPLDIEKWKIWSKVHRLARNEEEIKMSMKKTLHRLAVPSQHRPLYLILYAMGRHTRQCVWSCWLQQRPFSPKS